MLAVTSVSVVRDVSFLLDRDQITFFMVLNLYCHLLQAVLIHESRMWTTTYQSNGLRIAGVNITTLVLQFFLFLK